ncbi:MAG: 16S rRNA (cytosine(1402)-N(4))-methyltransferase, partial [Candidatus Binatia bacterium]
MVSGRMEALRRRRGQQQGQDQGPNQGLDLMASPGPHLPVMVSEVVEWLAVRPGGRYVDATLGDGGHACCILENSAPDGHLLGLDW